MYPNSSINSSHLATNNGDDNTFYSGGSHGGAGVAFWSGQPQATTGCLIRQSSSPPAFLHQQLTSDIGGQSYNNNPQAIISSHKHKQSRLSSDQLTFKKASSTSSTPSSSRRFTIGPWEECNTIVFDGAYDPQIELSKTGRTKDDLNALAEDSVAWRIRAKRGFATHPRSIAERERRIKINYKLKSLQKLLPNVDKQTSYAEMLDLAIEHVKDLQNQIQELGKELNSCTCGCKHEE